MKIQIALAVVSTFSLCQAYTAVTRQAYQDAADAVAAAWKKSIGSITNEAWQTSLDQLKKAVTDPIDTAATSEISETTFQSMIDQMSDAVKKAKPPPRPKPNQADETALKEAVEKHHKAIVGKCLSLPKDKGLTLSLIKFMCDDPDKNLQKCVAPRGKPELAKVWDYFNKERLRASYKKPFCKLDPAKELKDRADECYYNTKMSAADCLGEKDATAERIVQAIGSVRQ